jgi:WD40 repeat protein
MTRTVSSLAGTLLTLAVATVAATAAPVPTDGEKPKPRPRLVGTFTLPVEVSDVIWLPDGKHLVLRCGDGLVQVIRRDQFGDDEPTGKPVSEFKLPPRCRTLALSPDGTELYTVGGSDGRLTAESRAHFWAVKRVLEGKDLAKPDRTVSLETDVSGLATLAADGRSFVVPVVEGRKATNPNAQANQQFGGPGMMNVGWGGGSQPQDYSVRFDRLSAKTGDRRDEWAKFDDADVSYSAHAVDAKANRLIVQLHTADETVVRGLDLATGKQAWERKLQGQPQKQMTASPVVSPDGGLIAVTQAMQITTAVAPQPGGAPVRAGRPQQMSVSHKSIPVLLNAKTGEQLDLAADDVTGVRLHGFSADGRLLVGVVSNDRRDGQVVVWDTKTGKVAKSWQNRRDATFEFAPTGHELLVVERDQKQIYGPSVAIPQHMTAQGQTWSTTREVVRTDHTSTFGVWDLSPLAK